MRRTLIVNSVRLLSMRVKLEFIWESVVSETGPLVLLAAASVMLANVVHSDGLLFSLASRLCLLTQVITHFLSRSM